MNITAIPSLQAPLEKAADQPGSQPPAVFLLFEKLVPELQFVVQNQLDMPTRWSFSWTCRLYHAAEEDKDFDCFAFADKCAELGYVALLRYSYDRGGPWDEDTSRVAARHGQMQILEMAVDIPYDKKSMSKGERIFWWASEAVKAGAYQSFAWFEQFLDRAVFRCEYACAALKGGNRELARKLLTADCSRARESMMNSYYVAAALGDLEMLERIRLLGGSWENPYDLSSTFRLGVSTGQVNIVSWCIANAPSLLTEESKQKMIETAVLRGYIELLKFAESHGGQVTQEQFHPSHFEGELPHFRSLQYMHQKFGLVTAPFHEKFKISAATQEEMEWMVQQGYQFECPHVVHTYLHARKFELVPWSLSRGIQPSANDFYEAARARRVDVLNRLWQAKSSAFPDDTTMQKVLHNITSNFDMIGERFRLRPLLKTLKWLLDHGYVFGSTTKPFDDFLALLRRERPQLFIDSYDAINELNLPLSDKAKQSIEAFLALA